MSAARSQCHRTAHWLGIAIAVPLLILAGWAAFEGWHQPDQDDRNEYFGIALFARVAALAGCGLVRAIGWFLAELLQWRLRGGGKLAAKCSVLILQLETVKLA